MNGITLEGIGTLTNNLGNRRTSIITTKGVFNLENRLFSIEGEIGNTIIDIRFRISDIVYGQNMDYLLFSKNLDFKNTKYGNVRDVWYLKQETGLSDNDEKFLRGYISLSNSGKVAHKSRYEEIHAKIHKHVVEERERLLQLINKSKGYNEGGIELF